MPLAQREPQSTAGRDWLTYASAATLLSLLIVDLSRIVCWVEAERTGERSIAYAYDILQRAAASVGEACAKPDIQLQRAAQFHADEMRSAIGVASHGSGLPAD